LSQEVARFVTRRFLGKKKSGAREWIYIFIQPSLSFFFLTNAKIGTNLKVFVGGKIAMCILKISTLQKKIIYNFDLSIS